MLNKTEGKILSYLCLKIINYFYLQKGDGQEGKGKNQEKNAKNQMYQLDC